MVYFNWRKQHSGRLVLLIGREMGDFFQKSLLTLGDIWKNRVFGGRETRGERLYF